MAILILVFLALLGIPAGLLIAKHTKEEIRKGILWMRLLIAASVISIICGFLFIADVDYKSVLITVSGFIFFLTLASLLKVRFK